MSQNCIFEKLKPQIIRVIKEHQIEGISFMHKNISDGSGCILAHSMGLGKTMQVISLCDLLLTQDPKKTILILMPVHTVRHVIAEFNHWIPLVGDYSPLVEFGKVLPRIFNVHTIKDSQRTLKERFKILEEWSQMGGVLILGYDLFRSFILRNIGRKRPLIETVNIDEDSLLRDKLKKFLVRSNLIICDEGHKIKHIDTQIFVALQELPTKLRIVLTGYPLQNNLKEYFTIVDYVKPNFLGKESQFQMLFEKPITMGQYSDSTAPEVQLMKYRSYILQSLLTPFVHRRCEKLLQDTLPKKVEYTLFFRMTSLQNDLYKNILSQSNNNPISAFGVICKIMNDPHVLFDYLQDQKQADIEDEDKKIYYQDLLPIMEGYVPALIDTSPKMITLFQIIDDTLEQNDKMIIFSQSLLTLNMVEKCLQFRLNWKKNHDYYRIDGSASQQSRHSMTQKFNNNSQSKLFLLFTKAGCLGISLVGANRVVVFDASFNPSDDLQAIGRVYRYGQMKNTFVYRFVMDKSLERSIFDHQVKKQQMSNRIIDKLNPEPYMSLQNASSSYFKCEEEAEVKDFSALAINYDDFVIKNILSKLSIVLTNEPFENQSFLVDSDRNKLSEKDALLANIDFKLAKEVLSNDSDNTIKCSDFVN